MKKQDFKEFTVDARIAGPTREVQFTTGDVMVTSPALIIKGVTAADAWQILLILDQGLFSKEELEADSKAETAPPAEDPPEPPKKKRKTKAQKKAEEKAAAAAAEDAAAAEAGDPEEPEEEPEEEEPEEPEAPEEEEPEDDDAQAKANKRAQAKLDAERLKTKAAIEKSAKKKSKSNGKVAGIDLEQFKSASGLRELVGDFKEAGVESKEDVITYCTELQGMGLKCLKGVNIERRVANLWAMVA